MSTVQAGNDTPKDGEGLTKLILGDSLIPLRELQREVAQPLLFLHFKLLFPPFRVVACLPFQQMLLSLKVLVEHDEF